MNKAVSVVIVAIMLMSPGYAYNALEQNNIYRNQLNELARQQHAENQNHLLYYKGVRDVPIGQSRKTSALSVSATEKNIYAKKGVKFKVDNSNETQLSDEASVSNKEELKLGETTAKNETKKTVNLKSTAKTGLKSVANKVNHVKETTLQLNSAQNQKTSLPKEGLKPAVSVPSKNYSAPKPSQIPMAGKNADAE